MNIQKSIIASLVVAGLSTSSAFAADQTDIQVTASVINNCAILGANDINFGPLDPAVATDVKASGGVSFACTKDVNYTLSADMGQNSNNGARRMKGGTGAFLPYALSQDSVAGTGGGFSNPISVSLGASIAGTDYKDLPASAYADTLRLTVMP